MLRLSRRGQTAIETLFIVAIVMAGIALAVPTYLNENRTVSIAAYVRASASHAADYINMGVAYNESPYTILNPLLSNISGNPHLGLVNMTVSDNGTVVNITLTFVSSATLPSNAPDLVESFIVEDVARNTNAGKRGSNLIYSNREIVVNVRVVRG